MWRAHDVRAHGEGTKHVLRPRAELLALEYSAFAVDGRPDLSLVAYNPATQATQAAPARVRALMAARTLATA